MKHLFLILLTAIILTSCSVVNPRGKCYPSKGSRDYAIRQWMKQRSDGYWVVTTIHGLGKRSVLAFECKPDSIMLDNLKRFLKTAKVVPENKG